MLHTRRMAAMNSGMAKKRPLMKSPPTETV
jgi:hypothetical protein